MQLWTALPDADRHRAPAFQHVAEVPRVELAGGLVQVFSGALEGQGLAHGTLYYLGTQRAEMTLTSTDGARVLLVGGLPFPETILMWWTFVARTPDEIREARGDWEAHRRFGDVSAYGGPRLAAPDLLRLTRPNPMN